MVGQVAEYGIDVYAASIGKNQFQKVSPQHEPQAVHHIVIGEGVLVLELRKQVARAFYGAGHQLGKERHKQGIGKEVLFYRRVSTIHVYGVSQCLEDVKRYANGQEQRERWHAHGQAAVLQQAFRTLCCKGIVFEEKQDAKVGNEAKKQAPSFVSWSGKVSYAK